MIVDAVRSVQFAGGEVRFKGGGARGARRGRGAARAEHAGVAVNPRRIPCRMCQAAPGALCKYKGEQIPIGKVLGGHDEHTSESYRCYHYKRVADSRLVRNDTRRPPSARRTGP